MKERLERKSMTSSLMTAEEMEVLRKKFSILGLRI